MEMRARRDLPAGAGCRPQRGVRRQGQSHAADQIRREVAKAGVFGLEDMIPLPCNPDQICIDYGLRDGPNVTPITSLLPRELILEGPNTNSYAANPKLRQAEHAQLS